MGWQGVARPCGRAGHAMALLQVEGRGHVLAVCTGRTSGDRLCHDTWVLELPAPARAPSPASGPTLA